MRCKNGISTVSDTLRLLSLYKPLEYFINLHKEYGDFIKINQGVFGATFIIYDPEIIREFMTRGKRTHRLLLRNLVGNGLFVSPTGEHWQERRSLIQQTVARPRLSTMTSSIIKSVDKYFINNWGHLANGNQPFGMLDEMKELTTQIVINLIFSDTLGKNQHEFVESVKYIVHYLDEEIFARIKFPSSWKTSRNRTFADRMAFIRKLASERLKARREKKELEDDMLQVLADAINLNTGKKWDDAGILEEIISLLVAGTETSNAGLTFIFHLLAHNPTIQNSLRININEVLGERLPSFEDIPQLNYSRRVVLEGLRLYPPAWALLRVFDEGTLFGGIKMEKNNRVWAPTYAIHRHPAYWVNPENFDPSRFLPENIKNRPQFAYFPFGGGPHQCVASELAQLEATIVVTCALQKFEVISRESMQIPLKPGIALAPVHSPQMQIKRKSLNLEK